MKIFTPCPNTVSRIRALAARTIPLILISCFALLSSCKEQPRSQADQTPATAINLITNDCAPLRERFNADSAKVRLLVLLSPT